MGLQRTALFVKSPLYSTNSPLTSLSYIFFILYTWLQFIGLSFDISKGKGMSVWDTYVRRPFKVADGSTGNVACDSYHRYKEDVALLKNLGVSFTSTFIL